MKIKPGQKPTPCDACGGPINFQCMEVRGREFNLEPEVDSELTVDESRSMRCIICPDCYVTYTAPAIFDMVGRRRCIADGIV